MEKEEMTLNEYQEKAMTTCLPSANNFSYMMLNLVGEVGELSSKVAKQIRKEHITIGEGVLINGNKCEEMSPEDWENLFNDLRKELGDILWQTAGIASVMNWKLEDIAQMNLDKLAARKKIGTIDGNGDGVERGK